MGTFVPLCYKFNQTQRNMLHYEKLMNLNPTSYGKITNSKNQEIEFLEHPTKGDEEQVLCVCHELKLADYSGFFDTEDFDTEDYEPSFQNGKLFIGGFEK